MTDTVLSSPSPDQHIDITRDVCPMTFVRTRLALDRLSSGQTLLVRMRGDEPRRNVPLSAQALGHVILQRCDNADGTSELLLRKA